ncbi:MAG: LuxR C-terminal-related transcriptional regulator [Nitrosomonadales bacterium]
MTLSSRERQILHSVSNGMSSLQIAHELNIETGTVYVNRRNLMRKLQLHTAVELTRYAMNTGLTET